MSDKMKKPPKPRESGLGHLATHEFGWVRRWVRGPCFGCGMVPFWWGGDSKSSQEVRYRATDGTVYRKSGVPPCPTPVLRPGRGRGRPSGSGGCVDSDAEGTPVAGIPEGVGVEP